MNLRIKKILTETVILLIAAVTLNAKSISWGDKNADGVREGNGSRLYNPARYAFDKNEQTFWSAEEGEKVIWVERYWEEEKDIRGAEIKAELCEGSRLSFYYEKDGTWIPVENGIIKGPVEGFFETEFTKESRKTNKILITLESSQSGQDLIYEINLKEKNESVSWGKIEPESYSFNQKEYINLKPSRLWDGYVKECWYEPLWYMPYEIQQSKEYKSGIFAPYNGNPQKEAEIIWELDGSYRIDLIKAYFEAGARSIAFEFWDGKKWTKKREVRNSSKTGWNRLESTGIETRRIRITFPAGWESARLISQIEVWGEGEKKNTAENILFAVFSDKSEYEAVIEGEREQTELELITEGGAEEALSIYVNGNRYDIQNAEFKSKNENVYRIKIREDDLIQSFQKISIKTNGKKLNSIIERKDSCKDGRVQLAGFYGDRYTGRITENCRKEYEKTIKLDRKYELEKVYIYTKDGNNLRLCTEKGNWNYREMTCDTDGLWKAEIKGAESRELKIISDSEFEIDEAYVYGSPCEDKECAVEIWSSDKGGDSSSCITGWKGSRESQIVIDGKLHPRQEGCLFWLPVKEAGEQYLRTESHTVTCTEGNKKGEIKYRVNPGEDKTALFEKLKKEPLTLSIDLPYGNLYTQSEELQISGRYGNGVQVKIYADGKEAETENGRYKVLVNLAEGENLIRVNAKDITGRTAEKTVYVYRDSIKPEIQIISPVEGEYINSGKAEFCIHGIEEGLWWQFNDEEWESGNGKIKYKDYYLEDGFYTYTVKAQDRSGNVSDEKSVNFCMDAAAPEAFSIDLNVSGWTNNTQPEAIFGTSDATSGIDYYEYKIDDGIWKICESPLKLEKLADGIRFLYVRAIDKAGNIREEKAELYIDTSIPPEPEHARPVSSDETIIVKWEGADDNSIVNENPVAREGNRSYIIERNPQWKDGEKILRNYGYGELSFTDTEVEIGKSYSYRLGAIDRAGNESGKTEWKSAITGLAVSQISDEGETIIEYDGMTVTIPKGAAAEDVVQIQINRITDELIENEPLNPVTGSTYRITAVRRRGEKLYVTAHADLKIPAVVEIAYKPSLIPDEFTDGEIAAFYHDDIWGVWLQIPESYINTKNHTVLFRTEHFSDFNVQATKKIVLSEAQLREGAYKLQSEKTGPSEVRVSGEDGGVSCEFTEYIMPGKAEMSLPVQRVYTTSKAYADAAKAKDEKNFRLKDIDGETVWNIADGWKINMPYMKINSDSIVIYGTQGQCFTSGQMHKIDDGEIKDVTGINYHVLMECNEYSDVRADFLFWKKEETDWINSRLSLGTYHYTAYSFKGAVLHQGDGKKIRYDKNGKVTSIEDCTGQQIINFDYKDNQISITDTLENDVLLEKENGRIKKIITGTGSVQYEIQNDKLISCTDIAGRRWTYGYESLKLINKSELLNPPAGYKQSTPKEYDVPALSSLSGKGYGQTKIEYEVKNDLTYTDLINNNTYEVTQGKLLAKNKKVYLNENDTEPLRTTEYTIEYGGPVNKQFYVLKSAADDGQTKTETVYYTVLNVRNRLSNAPEAIRKTWAQEEYNQNLNNRTGEQEKETKQLLTYAGTIRTYAEGKGLVQYVQNEIDSTLMRMTKVVTKKGEGNTITDEYEYYKKYTEETKDKEKEEERIIEDYNGNVTEEKHVYETAGHKSSIVIKREYSAPVNNRTNLVTKMTKTASGFDGEKESSNTVTESYGYDSSGLLVTKTTAKGSWNYRYENGELKEVSSPEKRLTQYGYDYPDPKTSDVYTITTTRTAAEGSSFGTDEEVTETRVYDRKTGSLKKETDADGYVSEYDYDVLGRMTLSKKNDGKAVVTVIYDDENLKTKVTDELGCVTINQFDNLGRLVEVSKTAEDKNITVLLEYDGYDRVIKMSEPSYEDIPDISKAAHASYEYDSLGRITRFTDTDNHITEYSYIDSLNMTEVSKGGLEKTRVYKDNPGNIIKKENWIKDSEWVTGESWFDGEGKTLCTEDAEGNRTLTGYNSLGLVQTITCPDSLVETRMYDADGILYGITRTQNGKNLSKEEYELDCFGRTACRKNFVNPEDENSKKVSEIYEYNKRGYVTQETICYENDSSDERKLKKVYDWAGNVTEQTDGEGNITSYDYDVRGNLVKLTDPRENSADYKGEYFMQMEYDKFGRLVKGWIPHAQRRSVFDPSKTPADVLIEYDAQGNVIKRTDNTGDAAEALVTEYEYTKAGALTSETCGTLVTKYEYDKAGRLVKTTDTNGIITNRSYDGSGRLISEKIEGEDASLRYEYYPNGTVKSKTDRNGNVTSYKYDSMNRLTEENISGLLKKTCGWDGLGRKLWENDGEENLRNYEYDGLGRLTKEITPDGIELFYHYDARGNVTEFIDGRQTKFVREYTKTDLLKKEMAFVLETENKYCDNPSETRTYEYDEAGIIKTASDSSTSISYNQASGKYESDAYGNIRSMKWNENGPEMKYDYDLLGRTTGVTTPEGKRTEYSYDRSGLLAAMSGFVKGNIKYEENKSRIQSFTFENGIEKTFKYNSLGNISSIEYSEESKNIKTGFSYSYDDNYNITSRTALDTAKTSWFTYDKADRLTQSQLHGAFKTREQLDNGRLSQIERDLDGTKDAEMYFDALPENITLDTASRSFVYDFERDVSVNRIELFPDAYTHRVRERDIRLYCRESETSEWKEIKNWKFTKNEKNGSLAFAFKEAVNARQIKLRCTWDDRNFLNVSIDTKSTFKGNPQNLLRIWTLEESRIEEYEYDGNSNRKSIKENGIERTYQYYKNKNEGNTPRVMKDGKWWYTYDSNGNRTAKGYNKNPNSNLVEVDETKEYWTYTWDLWNRLVKVEQHNAPDNAETVCVEYTYDVLNHRIERISRTKEITETTQYAYGRNGAITYQKKTSGDSVTTRSFVYLNNQIVGFTDKEVDKESEYYTVTDIQCSVIEVYDEGGSLVWKSGYTAFGIKAGETTSLLDFAGLYTGCDYDSETGLSYHWNRWRSEDGDSWLSEDPAHNGLNWYGYAGQNPTNYIDRNGLFAYNGKGEQVSTISGELEKSESSSSKMNENNPNLSETPNPQPQNPEPPNPIPNIGDSNKTVSGSANIAYGANYDQIMNDIYGIDFSDGIPAEFLETHNFLSIFENMVFNKDNPLNQLVLDKALGLKTNSKSTKSCQTTSVLNAYAFSTENGITGKNILNVLQKNSNGTFGKGGIVGTDGGLISIWGLGYYMGKELGTKQYITAGDEKIIPPNILVNMSGGAIFGLQRNESGQDDHYVYRNWSVTIDPMDHTRSAASEYTDYSCRPLFWVNY